MMMKITNTNEYMENIVDELFEIADKQGEVELDDYEFDDNTIEIEIKTLTACSEPEVNYYEDGFESIEKFMNIVAERFQVKTEFEEDFTVGGNCFDEWVIRDGWLKLTI